MIGKLIGALVGREIDRRDGEGGVKGAVLGAVAVGALRRLGPLGLVLGGGYLAKKAYDRRRDGRTRPAV
ncbi:hypothetical protein [Sphingomonas quercus]|uniref:Uncharacterized protein n=1 Tax=Sphingomonas quercus TaxID=2842451 RepID=A0ABS6BK21_9SPHN|nr:hypothetical protein [Sphingomonas quercus]MBU3077977.1 hypothetical protein [Sphingomonas quercus]